MCFGVALGVGDARSLSFAVDSVSLAPLAAQCPQGLHLSVATDKTQEVSRRVVRCPHHAAGIIHSLRAVPPRVAIRRSQSPQVDHLPAAVKKRMIAPVSS